jgi:predicted Zn-dependent protease
MGYMQYYLLIIALQYLMGLGFGIRSLAAAAVVAWLLRRWLPDPYLYFKHASRVHSLKIQIAQNSENVTARRDLAKIHLDRRRPRRAIPLLEQALRRDAESAELWYLLGRVLLEAGRPADALPPLVEAASRDEKLLRGEVYLVAARALEALKRHEEAEESLLRYLAMSSSTIEGRVRLARVRRKQGHDEGAREALRDAIQTHATVPRYRRRAELRWYLLARVMQLGLL